jgi:hypothetical protein
MIYEGKLTQHIAFHTNFGLNIVHDVPVSKITKVAVGKQYVV